MSDIISRRQRTPWFWPDFMYYTVGDGWEHDSTLKVLHSFTYKVSRPNPPLSSDASQTKLCGVRRSGDN